jgi:hypothetical protein
MVVYNGLVLGGTCWVVNSVLISDQLQQASTTSWMILLVLIPTFAIYFSKTIYYLFFEIIKKERRYSTAVSSVSSNASNKKSNKSNHA